MELWGQHIRFSQQDVEMTTYIYESPNGGKTVTRREIGMHQKYIHTPSNRSWTSMEDVEKLLDNLQCELEIRRKYPAVQAAYDNYLLLMKLARSGDLTGED